MKDYIRSPSSPLIKIAVVLALLWTVTLGGLFYWSAAKEIKQCSDLAFTQTSAFFHEFLMTRFWNAMHRGVYVPVTEDTQPNPFLEDDPYRDLITTSGMTLTKLNPAYMTRQISKVAKEKGNVQFHLTGLKPINPENSPDLWEEKVLRKINSQDEYFELVSGNEGEKMFRYFSTLIIEPMCLECHERYGDKLGDKRGGISISIAAQPFIATQNDHIKTLLISYLAIWLIGFLAIGSCSVHMHKNDRERTKIIEKLQLSLKEVKQLSGLLPICCSCKSIRNDKGYWTQVEEYISAHAEIQFSHGICPTCAEKLYPEFNTYDST